MHDSSQLSAVLEYLSTVSHGLLGLADLMRNGEMHRISCMLQVLALQTDESIGHLKNIRDNQNNPKSPFPLATRMPSAPGL